VLWGDQDAIGHVNNVVPLRWIESARVRYLEPTVDPLLKAAGFGLILAANNINYRRQVNYPDTVWAAARVIKMGSKSFTFGVAVYSEQQDAIAVDGEAVVVCFDYATNSSQRIPDSVREQIEALEGDSF
jgi:acyl-CoA thioester hydrolase